MASEQPNTTRAMLAATVLDVEIIFAGSMTGFKPISDSAKAWISEHCVTAGWQWLGNTLYVESRFAADVEDGMVGDGLVVEVP